MIAAHCPVCGESLPTGERHPRCPRCEPGLTEAKTIAPQCEPSATLPPREELADSSRADSTVAGTESSRAEADDTLPGSQPLFLAPAQGPEEIGRLGGYRVLRVLGHGGMGLVLHAEDPQLERPVALKTILPALAADRTIRQRLLSEARAAAAIRHRHVVTIYQVGEDRGVVFLAMEFLEGEPLDRRLEREGRQPLAEVLRLGREIAEGLAAAHDRGLIHRDIKPANLWIETDGNTKVLDFGLARAANGSPSLTRSGAIVGTPAYMAPEQASGKPVDARTDLFSLGCVLYRLATGQPPFQGEDIISTLMAVATESPRPPRERNPELPEALNELILALLAKNPADRPNSARQMVEVIRALEKGRTDGDTTPLPRFRRAAAPPRWRRMLLALALVGLVGAIVAAGVFLIGTPEGTVEVVSTDPKVQVLVEDNGGSVTILDPESRQKVVLRAGRYHVKLGPGAKDLELSTDHFTLSRGGKQIVSVRRRDAVPRVPTWAELAARPSPLDQVRRQDVPAAALAWYGLGDPAQAPAELVGVLGDTRFRVTEVTSFAAWSPDGKRLALPSGNDVFLFDAATGQFQRRFTGHQGRVEYAAFSPDGQDLATASWDGVAKL